MRRRGPPEEDSEERRLVARAGTGGARQKQAQVQIRVLREPYILGKAREADCE